MDDAYRQACGFARTTVPELVEDITNRMEEMHHGINTPKKKTDYAAAMRHRNTFCGVLAEYESLYLPGERGHAYLGNRWVVLEMQISA